MHTQCMRKWWRRPQLPEVLATRVAGLDGDLCEALNLAIARVEVDRLMDFLVIVDLESNQT